MRSTRRMLFTGIPAAALGALLLTAAAPAAPFIDGYELTMKLTMDPPPQGNAGPVGATFKMSGEKLRLEMDMSQMGMGGRGGEMAGGAFMLMQPGGKVAVVIPGMNMAMAMDAGGIFGGGGRGRGMGGGSATATDVSVTVEDLGSGGTLIGHSTRKYRMRSKYTMNGTPREETSEMWITTDFPGAEAAFAKLGSFFSGSGGPAVAEGVTGKMPKGLPLKVVSTGTNQGTPVTTTMEMTDVKKVSFNDSEFELPPGVTVMDLGAMMRGRGGLR